MGRAEAADQAKSYLSPRIFRGPLMAGGFLGKTLAAVSLSVALASVTVKSFGSCSVAACRYSRF